MPIVSVVLNCYNHEPYVGEAIESVLRQTFSDFELIIIDNGSTDGSRAVMQSYSDPRIRLSLNDQNQSISKRLNEGAAMATGEFLSILYSDDFMLPEKLERQVALFRDLPPEFGVVYCPARGLNQHTGEMWQHPSFAVSGNILSVMLRRHFDGAIDMCSPLTRRECHLRYGWHEDLFADGEAVFFRIAMRYQFKFDPEPQVVLRDHGGNMGKAVKKNHDMFMVVLDRLAVHPDFPPENRVDVDADRALACRNNGWAALRMGTDDGAWARRQFATAVRLQPRQLFHPRLLAGMLLSSMPMVVRTRLNRIGNAIRRSSANTDIVVDYA